MNRHLDGGCQVPIACYAIHTENDQLWLRGLVGSPDGQQQIFKEITGHPNDAETLGIQLAKALLADGAGCILKEVIQNG